MRYIKILALLSAILSAGNSYSQQHTRLNGSWQFIRQDLGGIWEAVRPVKPADPESVPIWENVLLPHCFNARDGVSPDVNYYQGPGWYRTQLKLENPYQQGRTLLHFEGAGQQTDVYVYTTKVASHLGGYDEWTADITQAVADFKKTEVFQKQFKGQIPISIRCDNSRNLETIPSQMSDFNIYGGLYRYVNLVYNPPVSIDKIFATAEVDKAGAIGKLSVKGRFYSSERITPATGTVKLIDPKGKQIATRQFNLKSLHGDIALADFAVKKPELWHTDKPLLYKLEISINANGETYRQVEKVGFRNFEFLANGPFMLNGKRLLLRGTHRHEDYAGVAAAMTEEMMRTEMQQIKDMGANFIRLGHYQQSNIILNLCDSLGILVWEEEPWCRGGLGGEAYQTQARRMMTNMIEQHYNHPSVILWGLGNENDWPGDFPEFDKNKIRAFMKEQNDLTHRLDSTRKTTIRRCDFCADIPDVYSPSIWAGWYRDAYTDYKKISLEEFKKVKHFFHAEWGGDSHAGRHAETHDNKLGALLTKAGGAKVIDSSAFSGGVSRAAKDGDWSESYICNLFDWHLKEQENMPWLTGSAFWVFRDFSTPLRPDNPVPYVNQKGVAERDGTPKESFYLFQSYWSNKPMAHIYGHNWPVRWGEPGEIKMVKVYSNCNKAELFINGKSMGIKKRNSQDFPGAGLRWLVPFNKGKNEIRVIAKSGKTVITDEITQEYQTEKWQKPAQLAIEKLSEKDGVQTLQVKLLDANGVPCLDAANWVSFSIAGDGTLLDDLGTSRGSRKVQAYNGRAIISLNKNGGKSVVSASSAGIKSVFIEI